jgi:hypothetical protein
MSKHVDKLLKEVDDAKDKLDAYKRRVCMRGCVGTFISNKRRVFRGLGRSWYLILLPGYNWNKYWLKLQSYKNKFQYFKHIDQSWK